MDILGHIMLRQCKESRLHTHRCRLDYRHRQLTECRLDYRHRQSTEVFELLLSVSTNHKDPELQLCEVEGSHRCHYVLRFIELRSDTFQNLRIHECMTTNTATADYCMTA